MQTLEKRLQKLEASNRRYQTIIVLMISSVALFFMAFKKPYSAPDVIQAKRFEVVDNNGRVLVTLNQDDGKGLIKTYNRAGRKLVNITYTTNEEGYFGIEDGQGNELMRFSSSNDGGGGYIGVYNPEGKRTLTLCNDQGGGNVYISDSEGKTRGLIQCNGSGGGMMNLYNTNGQTAIKLTQTSSGNGDLYINNRDGDERVRLAVSSSAGNIQLRNNSKTMVVELGGTSSENGTINTYKSTGGYIQGIGGSE